MSEAVLESKPSAQKTLDMVAGKPLPCSEAACQPCHRVDQQFLIVTPGVVPKVHAEALAAAGYRWNDTFDLEFGGIEREATVPVARLARDGYIYLYYEARQRWDVWQVMEKGLTRQIVYQANNDQCSKRLSAFIGADAPKGCSQGARNLAAHLICVEGASTLDKVWFAYSAEMWALKVLERYAANPDVQVAGPDGKPVTKKLRDFRGRELPLKAMVAGAPARGCLPLDKTTLASHVADFVDKADPKYFAAFEQAVKPINIDRIGQADAFANRVRAIEKAGGTRANPNLYIGKSVIVMLSDDVGVVEDHNQLRLLAKEAREEWVRGAPDFTAKNDDPLRPWKLRSALHEEMIEGWVFANNLQQRKEAFDHGTPLLRKQVISGYEYGQIQDYEKRTGKPYHPPGTTYERLDGPVERYRVTWSQDTINKRLEDTAHEDSKSRIERYRGKLRLDQLTQFRQDFKAGMESWQKHLVALDTDYVQWLTQARLAATVRHDVDGSINLVKLDAACGTPAQQVEAWMARVRIVGKCWGGGALTPVSVRELAKAYGKDSNAPAKWIDDALLEPFGYAKAIANDPGKSKDAAEKINGLAGEMPEKVKEILHLRHELHAEHLETLAQASQQAAQIHASLVDPATAKLLGLAPVAADDAQRVLRLEVRTAAILDLMTNPAAERYITIGVKLPTGEALDKMAEAFQQGNLEMKIETKNETTRQMRRKTANKLRKLAGRPGFTQPEFQPIALTEKRLAQLEKLAAKSGEEMVEVIADEALGKHLPAAFKLPKSMALNLIGEQASGATAARKALMSRSGATVGVLALFQGYALWKSLEKLGSAEGYEHTDLLMTTFTASTGLLEGSLTLSSGYYEIKTQGSKLVLSSVATRAALVRLAVGIAGAAGSAFDAYAAYAKYCSMKEKGSREAMKAYGVSSGLFWASTVSISTGTILTVAAKTTARFAFSEALVARAGGAVVAEMIGVSLTGVGIVLGVAGFACVLYAESLEDDLNDIFLKRSYWGKGEAAAAPYGIAAKADDKADAEARQRWATQGLKEEVSGFNALAVGFKSTLEWTDGKMVIAKVETANGGEQRRVSYALAIQGADSQALLKDERRDAELELDEGRYVLKVKLPVDPATWKAAQWASFDYKLYEEFERNVIAADVLQVKKPA